MLNIRVNGIGEVEALIERLQAFEGLEALRTLFGAAVHSNIKQRTPVDTGLLRASNTLTIIGDRVIFENLQDYSNFVEFGTGRRGASTYEEFVRELEPVLTWSMDWAGMEAQPFQRPAIAEGIEMLDDMMDNVMDDML